MKIEIGTVVFDRLWNDIIISETLILIIYKTDIGLEIGNPAKYTISTYRRKK